MEQTTIRGTVISNIVDANDRTLNGKNIRLQIPCSCKRVFRSLNEIILVTPITIGPQIIRLGDYDLLLPFSRSFRRNIMENASYCKNLRTNALENIREYVDFFINKIRKRRRD